VQVVGAVTTMQTRGHGKPMVIGSIVPALAKAQGEGHPQF
jgi:hypothetical protein